MKPPSQTRLDPAHVLRAFAAIPGRVADWQANFYFFIFKQR